MNILITGGASGLGEAITRILAKDTTNTIFFTYSNSNLNAKEIELDFSNALSIKCDFKNASEVTKLVDKIESLNIDVLINNAGIVFMSNPVNCTLNEFRISNRIMSEGVFLGMKYSLPLLQKYSGGSIVNMSSTASHLGYPMIAYSAAKGAIVAIVMTVVK